MSHPKDASALLLSTIAAVMAAIPAAAWSQQSPPADPQPQQQQLQKVEITGSSIKRIDAETALPVQVITRDQIRKTGASTVEQLLQSVSSVSSSGGLTQASSSGATTGSISAVNIHGLTSERTLVLINGRRVSPYGIGFTNDSVSVDVNSIPLAAIERIEILKDGASAIYGSDAIAGVINFILRQDFHGVEATAEYGDSTRGGAALKRGAVTFGAGNLEADRYNVMVTASYQKENPLVGADRSFSNHGFSAINDTTSGNTFPANIAAVDGSFGSVNPTASTGCKLPYSQLDPNYAQTLCRFDVAPLVTLIPDSERASLFASGKFAITPDLTAFVEASYNRSAVRTIVQPVPISDQFALPPTNPLFNVAPYNGFNTIVLTTASPFYPTGFVQGITGGPTPDLLVRYRSQTGNRDITDVSEAPRAVAGIKGSALGWDVDAALLYTESKVREHDNNGWPIATEILPLLNSGTVNFFGPNTPAIQSDLLATNFNGDAYTIKTSITSLGGKASREVFSLPAGAVAVAVGAEARKEKYDFSPSSQIAAGDIEGYGGNLLPNHSTRDVEAVFGEVNIPIVKGLEGDVAVRYDHYERVGNSTTPKASLRWQPTQEILLRGSFGQGFRAPSLQDLYAPVTSGVTGQGSTDLLRCPFTNDGIKDCATQFGLLSGGNIALKPEKSNNLNLGAVLEPNKSLSVGIDYFRVLLKDAIVNGLGAAFILADPVKYASLIHRGPVDPNFPNLPGPITDIDGTNINLGNIKVSGFDIDLKWRLPVADWGRVTLTLDGTYFNRYDTSNPDGSYSGNVDLANNATGGVIPRLKTYSTVDWTMGPWNVNFAQNYQKSYNDQADNRPPNSDRRVASYITYDLQSTYSGFKAWRFTLGARNLFDRDPPYTNIAGLTTFQNGYDIQYGDPRGRFVYARVTYAIQ